MLKQVFLDCDGTLLDSEQYWLQAPIRLLISRHLTVPPCILGDDRSTFLRPTITRLLEDEKTAKALGMTWQEILDWSYQSMAEEYKGFIQPKNGAEAVLRLLKEKNIGVTVVTATCEEWVRQGMERTGLMPYLDEIVSTDGQPFGKEKPELFLRLAEERGVKPEECLLLDDAAYALSGAKAAGCAAWGIYDAIRVPEHNQVLEIADCFFDDLVQVGEALKELLSSR